MTSARIDFIECGETFINTEAVCLGPWDHTLLCAGWPTDGSWGYSYSTTYPRPFPNLGAHTLVSTDSTPLQHGSGTFTVLLPTL